MSSKVLVQRGPSANGSSRKLSPSSASGIGSNASHYVNPQVNRQLADFGIQGKPKQSNVGNQGNPASRKFNPAAQSIDHTYNPEPLHTHGFHGFDDGRSEYSCMSLPQVSQSNFAPSGLPIVNYVNLKGPQTTDRKPASMVVKEDEYQMSYRSKQRSHSPGDPMNASQSTTTFSYYTGFQAGERGKI